MRQSGILMHISSLPSKYGIGTLGKFAYQFVDFLKSSGQNLWQVLPIGPTGYGDSPYSSSSAFAYNPYFIDLEMLKEDGLLKTKDYTDIIWSDKEDYVDYGILFNKRYDVLYKAYLNFDTNDKVYLQFCSENSFWLDDYSLFMGIKKYSGYKSWEFWDNKYKYRDKEALKDFLSDNNKETQFIKVMQYLFYRQWKQLKNYANGLGIKIIGDMPIYVAYDSSDVWSNPDMFKLDKNLLPSMVAGVPPDYFNFEGQLWGNPLYDWKYLKDNNYSWWQKRTEKAFENFDYVRIDHFRGFESYYAIPYGDKNAKNGKWEKGPGIELFIILQNKSGRLNIIAEDLGFLDDDVRKMVKDTGFPGMKILQFAFGGDEKNEYLPHNYIKNCVVYTGTHDNNTTAGWYKTLSTSEKTFFKNYIKLKQKQSPVNKLIEAAFASDADTVIIPIQDYLKSGENARMNYPSKIFTNWKWRITEGKLSCKLSQNIKKLSLKYNRNET